MIEMESKNYSEALKERFNDEDIEWRIQQSGISNNNPWVIVVPYIQARAIQERLDSVFGFQNWEDTYRETKKNGWICTLTVNIGNKQIKKENGADETNIEATKGGISDSFKRVASSGYGIGRYLYKEKIRFAECSIIKTEKYTEKVKIKNGEKTYIFYWEIPKLNNTINGKQLKKLCTLQQSAEVSDKKLKEYMIDKFKIDSRKNLNKGQFEELINIFQKKIDKNEKIKKEAC